MKRWIIYGLLLMFVSTYKTVYAQPDTTLPIKRLIDEMATHPKFPGNVYEYLTKSIHYPHLARENGIAGRVMVRFLIDENGKVNDPFLIYKRRLGAGLEEEALRVVKAMPAWEPGTYKGKAVRVVYTLPVRFKLE